MTINRSMTPLEWGMLLLLSLLWGGSFFFNGVALRELPPLTIVALRVGLAAVILHGVILATGRRMPAGSRVWSSFFVMGLVNIVVPFALITWAEQSVDSSLAAILTAPVPLFAIVIAPFFLHDEPIRVNGVIGLLVGFVGVVILTSRDLAIGDSDLSGEIALLGAAFSYAIGAVYARRNMRGVPPLIPAVFQVSFALLVSGLIALLTERPWEAQPDLEAIFSILWLGIVGSGLAYLVVFRLFAAWGATRTTMVAYEIPVVGILLGFFVLAEPVDIRLLIGTALVVGGVALVNSPYGRRRLYGRVPPPVEAT